MPVLSIIMPAYNVEKYIGDAIRSLLNQTFTDWELIIVDDGSTDRTREIADGFTSCDSRIKCFGKSNGGVSSARNAGLREATGEYIHFMDSDDEVCSDFYATLLPVIAADETLSFVGTGYRCEFYKDERLVKTEIRANEAFQKGDALSLEKAVLLPDYFNIACNKIIRRSEILKLDYWFREDMVLIEDSDFNSRLIKQSQNFNFVDYAGYRYKMRNIKSLSKTVDGNTLSVMKNQIRILKDNLISIGADEDIVRTAPLHNVYFQYKYVIGLLYSYEYQNVDRLETLRRLLNDKELRQMIKDAPAHRLIDSIFRICVVYRLVWAIHLMFSLRFRRKQPTIIE